MGSNETFNNLVMNAEIKISTTNDTINVITSRIEGCRYAFYLTKNNRINKKIYYSTTNHCQFDISTSVPSDIYSVKVFYRKQGVKLTRICNVSWSNKIDIKKFSVRKNINDFTLKECEIIQASESKIQEYEDLGFRPRSDCKPFKLHIPIDWSNDPFNDRNWMYQLHAWRMLDPYLTRFSNSDISYIQKIINDWTYFELSNECKWLWYDMSTGLRALKIAYFLKKCQSLSIAHGINNLEYIIDEHLNHLSNPQELNPGNHGLFQLNGLKALTYLLSDFKDKTLKYVELNKYALSEMTKLIKNQLGNQGVHTENSPDYHFFAHRKIETIINSSWWHDIDSNINHKLKSGENAKPWLVFPDNKCVPIGDSSSGAKIKGLVSLNKWPHISSENIIGAKVDGYAIIRSSEISPIEESSFLFFQGSFYSHTHKHCDDLSFILQERGSNILIDSGKYGYQQDKYRKYFLSTAAHNTIVVDGVSTSRKKKHVYGSAIKEAPITNGGIWFVQGFVDHVENNYTHTRYIFYVPGKDLYVIDTIKNTSDNKKRNLSQWWHFDTDAKITISDNSVNATINKELNIPIESSCIGGDIKISSYKGNEKPFMAGWVSKKYLEYEPTTSLEFSSSLDDETIFLTRFNIGNTIKTPIMWCKDNKIFTKNSWVNNIINKKTDGKKPQTTDYKRLYHLSYDINYHSYKKTNFFFKEEVNSNKLLVTFHGSISPPKDGKPGTELPCFRLYNINIPHQPDVLCFSDLLLEKFKNNNVYLAWFLDTKKTKQSSSIIHIIEYHLKLKKYDEVIFHGSSGGGFISLLMASYFNQVAIISNSQFILDQHKQFDPLIKAVNIHNDELCSYDLKNLLSPLKGPKKFISYCNIDDYTHPHHIYANNVVNDLFPNTVEAVYFSGNELAKKNGLRNHSVGYPDNMKINKILAEYLK